RYQIDLVAAAQRARDRMEDQLRQICAAQIPGDTYRNLRIAADYSGQTFKHILAPVWLLSYHYGAKAYQVVINGSTGAISGEYPKSWVKISIAVMLAIIVLLLILAGLEGGL
ncbi:MAG: zinc ribbon domain-containing protein, partial [Candidatus Binatia bacterium]